MAHILLKTANASFKSVVNRVVRQIECELENINK